MSNSATIDVNNDLIQINTISLVSTLQRIANAIRDQDSALTLLTRRVEEDHFRYSTNANNKNEEYERMREQIVELKETMRGVQSENRAFKERVSILERRMEEMNVDAKVRAERQHQELQDMYTTTKIEREHLSSAIHHIKNDLESTIETQGKDFDVKLRTMQRELEVSVAKDVRSHISSTSSELKHGIETVRDLARVTAKKIVGLEEDIAQVRDTIPEVSSDITSKIDDVRGELMTHNEQRQREIEYNATKIRRIYDVMQLDVEALNDVPRAFESPLLATSHMDGDNITNNSNNIANTTSNNTVNNMNPNNMYNQRMARYQPHKSVADQESQTVETSRATPSPSTDMKAIQRQSVNANTSELSNKKSGGIDPKFPPKAQSVTNNANIVGQRIDSEANQNQNRSNIPGNTNSTTEGNINPASYDSNPLINPVANPVGQKADPLNSQNDQLDTVKMMLGTPTFVELRRQMDSKVLQLRVDLETFQDRIETDFQKLFRENKEMIQKFASKVDLARIEQEAGGVSEMKDLVRKHERNLDHIYSNYWSKEQVWEALRSKADEKNMDLKADRKFVNNLFDYLNEKINTLMGNTGASEKLLDAIQTLESELHKKANLSDLLEMEKAAQIQQQQQQQLQQMAVPILKARMQVTNSTSMDAPLLLNRGDPFNTNSNMNTEPHVESKSNMKCLSCNRPLSPRRGSPTPRSSSPRKISSGSVNPPPPPPPEAMINSWTDGNEDEDLAGSKTQNFRINLAKLQDHRESGTMTPIPPRSAPSSGRLKKSLSSGDSTHRRNEIESARTTTPTSGEAAISARSSSSNALFKIKLRKKTGSSDDPSSRLPPLL